MNGFSDKVMDFIIMKVAWWPYRILKATNCNYKWIVLSVIICSGLSLILLPVAMICGTIALFIDIMVTISMFIVLIALADTIMHRSEKKNTLKQ